MVYHTKIYQKNSAADACILSTIKWSVPFAINWGCLGVWDRNDGQTLTANVIGVRILTIFLAILQWDREIQ